MRKSSSIPTILVALGALVLYGYANHAAFHSGAHPDADQARQAEVQQEQAAKAKPQPPLPPGQHPNVPTSNGAAPATELTIGNPAAARTRLTFGYTADESVEQNSQGISTIISTLQNYAQTHPATSLQVVCLDIPVADRSDKSTAGIQPGITKNGKRIGGVPRSADPRGMDMGNLLKELG